MDPSVSFQLHDVPEYLRGSAFHQTLNADDDDLITLPVRVLKQDTTVNTVEEAVHLLSTLQFWGSDIIPEELIKLICTHSTADSNDLLDQFSAQFPTVSYLRQIVDGDDAQRVNLALSKGDVQIVAIMIQYSPQWDRESACRHAAAAGHLDCLEYIHKQGGTLDRTVGIAASHGGYIECFRYAHENGVEMDSFFTLCAAEKGHIRMLKYLRAHDCPWDYFIARGAAENNQLECLQYIHENGFPWTVETFVGAAASGHLEILKYLLAEGCPMDYQAPQNAAYHGHLECLKLLHAHNCPWDANLPAYAALRGQFECVKYLHEHGCPWSPLTTAMAAERNSLDILKYAAERGCDVSAGVYRWAARYGNIAMMRFAHEHGVPWDHVERDVVLETAKNGYFECLVFAHQCGCVLTSTIAFHAAMGRSPDCLKYVLTHVNVPAEERANKFVGAVCAAAASQGSLECLILAREHGCAWDKRTTKKAAAAGHLACLKYAVENRCVINTRECLQLATQGCHAECIDYITSLTQGNVPHRTKTCWSLY